MITRWVGTWAFMRDSHFSLISFPVIKSSEMDLSNCKVAGSIGLGEMSRAITFFLLSLFFPLLHFCGIHRSFEKLFWTIRRAKRYSSFDRSMAYSLEHSFVFKTEIGCHQQMTTQKQSSGFAIPPSVKKNRDTERKNAKQHSGCLREGNRRWQKVY